MIHLNAIGCPFTEEGLYNSEHLMTVVCFQKVNTTPPLCGIHYMPLMREQVPVDPHMPQLAKVDCFRCPVSGMIVKELEKQGFSVHESR